MKSTLEEHIFPARLTLHSVQRVNAPHLHALLDVITTSSIQAYSSPSSQRESYNPPTDPSRTDVNFGIVHILPARLLLYLHLLVG